MNSIKESGPVTAISGMPGSLRRVLGLAFGDRLPLHVPRRIGTAALQRDDVVDDVTRPSVRVAGLRHELLPGLRAAGDPPMAVPRADCEIIRRMAVPASAVIEPAALPGTTIIPAGTLGRYVMAEAHDGDLLRRRTVLGPARRRRNAALPEDAPRAGMRRGLPIFPFSGITRACQTRWFCDVRRRGPMRNPVCNDRAFATRGRPDRQSRT